MNLNRAFFPRQEDIKESWVTIDAAGKIVGRLATEIARIVRGSDQVYYTPFVKTGRRVVILNASKVLMTGKKLEEKAYRKWTGYVGNTKNFTAKEAMKKNPTFILENAIKGMFKRNKLERQLFKAYVKIYAGNEGLEIHKAQLKHKSI
jgi:large subunit ribosomal protein L13